ncbi:aspartic proteinase CDR1-like [Impatiens glandulifera]|uniref:aspartic proteinase CDR1-like n=1 Tax=Impatiens glandulifera TaxID=253017 RepID=UPI001FB0A86C|nr:aspartic proteinase CDR1-like [Impatiens glandulifera]
MDPPDFYYITLEVVNIQNMRFPFTGLTKGNKVGAHKGPVEAMVTIENELGTNDIEYENVGKEPTSRLVDAITSDVENERPVDRSKQNAKSKINFGSNAIVSGPGVVSTPLVTKSPREWYHVTLEGVSVRNTRIPFNIGVAKYMKDVVKEGNIVIDSGTTMTHLPTDMYQKLENTLRGAIKAIPVEDPTGELSLCYKNVNNFRIPTIIFHFAGGADVALETNNTIAPYSGLLCLAIIPSDDLAIYGNLSQMNHLIGYHLDKKFVYFKPTIC